jgi:hypothetical protein
VCERVSWAQNALTAAINELLYRNSMYSYTQLRGGIVKKPPYFELNTICVVSEIIQRVRLDVSISQKLVYGAIGRQLR